MDPIVKAQASLITLANDLHAIQCPHPDFRPGHEPTAEMHCRQLLDVLEWGLQQLAAYLNVPQEQIRDHTIKPGPRRSRGGTSC
jgi:hypothetical protein